MNFSLKQFLSDKNLRNQVKCSYNLFLTIRDIIAVGPSVTSFDVPRRVYKKTPMKLEYKPYCTGSPAKLAYASDCGITVKATVSPAVTSPINLSLLYSGIHFIIGKKPFKWFKLCYCFYYFHYRMAHSMSLIPHESTNIRGVCYTHTPTESLINFNGYYIALKNVLIFL